MADTPTAPRSTIADALRLAAQRQLARLDAQLLLLQALGRPHDARAWLLAHDDEPVAPEALARFEHLVAQRLDGVPVAYLLGEREFFGLRLQVDARVLDPRADTETLVNWALSLCNASTPSRLLDLGTGSGAIALALRHARPQAEVWAVDASADALAVARANAERLQLPVHFLQGRWLAPVQGRFDLIVSNPPYIAEHDPHLAALRHEPRQALVAGADGLDDLRQIVRAAPAHLHPTGWLLLEHGHDQAAAVCALLREAGFLNVQSRNDLAGIARCSGGQRGSVE